MQSGSLDLWMSNKDRVCLTAYAVRPFSMVIYAVIHLINRNLKLLGFFLSYLKEKYLVFTYLSRRLAMSTRTRQIWFFPAYIPMQEAGLKYMLLHKLIFFLVKVP